VKLTPTQRAQVRDIVLLSEEFRGAIQSINDQRAQRALELQDLKQRIARVENYEKQGLTSDIKLAAEKQLTGLREERDELQATIEAFEKRLADLKPDFDVASRLAARVLEHIGKTASGAAAISYARGEGIQREIEVIPRSEGIQ
jgi:hypothetical protein